MERYGFLNFDVEELYRNRSFRPVVVLVIEKKAGGKILVESGSKSRMPGSVIRRGEKIMSAIRRTIKKIGMVSGVVIFSYLGEKEINFLNLNFTPDGFRGEKLFFFRVFQNGRRGRVAPFYKWENREEVLGALKARGFFEIARMLEQW